MQTPWGQSDFKTVIAEGITSYSTPSHGGIHLSAKRQAEMPDILRIDSGWYEEDCDWCLVAITFPQYFIKEYAQAVEIFRHWHPDRYEKLNGVILRPGESHVKDEAMKPDTHFPDWRYAGMAY